jgi:hypothetical protein
MQIWLGKQCLSQTDAGTLGEDNPNDEKKVEFDIRDALYKEESEK